MCHFAFDAEEWTFLPNNMSTWLRDAKAGPENDLIQQWNSRRDIEYRPWRIFVDSLSEASQDKDFNAAFINNSTKAWSGEVGVVIISNNLATVASEDKDFAKAIMEWQKQGQIWRS